MWLAVKNGSDYVYCYAAANYAPKADGFMLHTENIPIISADYASCYVLSAYKYIIVHSKSNPHIIQVIMFRLLH